MNTNAGATPDEAIGAAMVRPAATGQVPLQADLVMQSDGASDRVFALREGRTTIGRDGRCDVRIPLPRISPRHCEIVLENQRATLFSRDEDLGTLLNGKIIREAPLAHDDEVSIGPVTFRVVLRTADDPDAH